MSRKTEYPRRPCCCSILNNYGCRGSLKSDTSDTDEYDCPRQNTHNPRLDYLKTESSHWDRHKYDNRCGLDDETWNTINSFRQKACRFIKSETEETTDAPASRYQCLNEMRFASADLLRRANDLIDYAPQSEFLKKMKQQSQYMANSQPNVYPFLSEVDMNCPRPNTVPRTSERMGYEPSPPNEKRIGYFAPLDDSYDPHCSKDEKLLDQLIDKRLPSARNVKQSKLVNKKSEHISRSKKPERCRGRRKRKSGSSEKCESEEQFEPSLKKPHENSCERCWRYASPARSPVNKPDQKFDPNFRRGHSCYDFEGGDFETLDRHVSPCKNLQPITSREKERPPSAPSSFVHKTPTAQQTSASVTVVQKNRLAQQSSVSASAVQKYPTVQQSSASASAVQKFSTSQHPSASASAVKKYATSQQSPVPASVAQKSSTVQTCPAPPCLVQKYPTAQPCPAPPCVQKYPTVQPCPAPPCLVQKYPTVQPCPAPPCLAQKHSAVQTSPIARQRTPELQPQSVLQEQSPLQQSYERTPRGRDATYDCSPRFPERSASRVPTSERLNQINFPVSLMPSPRPRPRSRSCVPDISPADISRCSEGIDDLDLTEYQNVYVRSREQFYDSLNTTLSSTEYANVTQQPLLEPGYCPRHVSPPRPCPVNLVPIPEVSHGPCPASLGGYPHAPRQSPVGLVHQSYLGQSQGIPCLENYDRSRSKSPQPVQKSPSKPAKSPKSPRSPKASKSSKSPPRQGSPREDSSPRDSGGSLPRKSPSKSPRRTKKGKSKSPSPKGGSGQEAERSPKRSPQRSPKSPPKEESKTLRSSDDGRTMRSADGSRSSGLRSQGSQQRPSSPDPRVVREPSLGKEHSPLRVVSQEQYLGLDHPIMECHCDPNALPRDPRDVRQGSYITCCHCNWQHHRTSGQSPRGANASVNQLTGSRHSPRGSPSGSRAKNTRVFDGRAYECPHRREVNLRAEEPNMDNTVSSSFERDCRQLSELQQTPPCQTSYSYEEVSRIIPPRRYFMLYMTKCDDKKSGNDVEVLVEELTQNCENEKDSRTKDLTEKMKKIMESPTESMALRFQKGVSEQCKTPQSSRILYF